MDEVFEWDEGKAAQNVAMQRVSFDVAIAVFPGPDVVDGDTARRSKRKEERAYGHNPPSA